MSILESACKELGVPATIASDQSSEVVSRYLSLAWLAARRHAGFHVWSAHSAMRLWASRALCLPRSMSAALGGKNVANSDICVQDRIKALKALRARRSDSAASSHAIRYKKKRIQSH